MKQVLSVIVILLLSAAPAASGQICLMVIDNNSYLAALAKEDLPPETGRRVQIVSASDLAARPDTVAHKLRDSSVILVDVMDNDLTVFLMDAVDIKGKQVYALRSSQDDDALKKKGVMFDDTLALYYRHLSRENLASLLRRVIHRHLDAAVSYGEVQLRPRTGIHHPKAPDVFTDAGAFLSWQAGRPGFDPEKPGIGLLFYQSFLTPGQQEALDQIIGRLENEGFNVMGCFGNEAEVVEQFLLDSRGRSRVDLVLAFSLKFSSALTPKLAQALVKLDVPLISGISLYRETVDEWRKSPVGIGVEQVAWSMTGPEISGLIEPTVLMAKEKIEAPKTGQAVYVTAFIKENLDRLIPRLRAWVNLRHKSRGEKKVAVLFYNHHQGKQNIGASYLNVFSSLEEIIQALAHAGYQTGPVPEADKIKSMILNGARNVGTWAPGELDALVEKNEAVLLDPDLYIQWFEALPRAFREQVTAQWGDPGAFDMMLHKGRIVIPMVRRGNLVLMPEPARGWGDDPMKLYHDTTLYPHHQYIAAYLWLKKQFRADAMIHLGTHATHEWTPGKQAGLSPACPPEVLITDIPNLYPYIVDDVGEAIQAKRRGRGVMISHLTPMLQQSGLFAEYSRMSELAAQIDLADARGAVTVAEKQKELRELAETTGVLTDLSRKLPEADMSDDDLAHAVSHYLEEIKEQMIPRGMHTFGRTRPEDEIREMAGAMVQWNPDENQDRAAERIRASADMEITHLLAGLDGRYVPPGEGNDPLRNPGAVPTGRNLFGINPARLPTPAAWELGKKAAEKIIADHRQTHGRYPETVAVVLWAVELLRNEGVNESTILWLMGIRPRRHPSGRITGLEVVPGNELGRPRIDVLINASGLYRDLFPDKMQFLDEAVQLAMRQTDIENLIARNSRRMQAALTDGGMDEKTAEKMSRLRIFSEAPGSYGNGISEMTGASGLWQDSQDVVDVYENRMGFAFGGGLWGKQAGKLFNMQLGTVDVALHSSSSNVYGLMDNDDMFAYLGGLAMAVRHASGRDPDILITSQKQAGMVAVEDVARTLGREMRSRYLNPKWIQDMKNEDYAGARAMDQFVQYFWGWQVTTPEKVSPAQWQQIHEVYVQDKYGLGLKTFFNQANPWAYQSITARMLEAVRKEYWPADEAVQQQLAAEYAVNVVENGVACCDHTCNNPLLNQMVVSLISLPGVLNPKIVEQFTLAVEQAVQQPLDRQAAEKKAAVYAAAAPSRQPPDTDRTEQADPGAGQPGDGRQMVEGYKMEKIQTMDDTTRLTSSGVEWLSGLVVVVMIILAVWGMRRTVKDT
jgi:cobaltochelatase CobN